jgi:carbon-monoxide dehydrogenase medium subunit
VRIAGRDGAREQLVVDFLEGLYATSLAAGEIVLGFDVPRPDAPLRWGFAKVARKSGAFANSIAFVVAPGKGGPVTVVLAAAGPWPIVLAAAAHHLANGTISEDTLRAAIADDLKAQLPDADAYQKRLHTATVIGAAREMRAKS